MEACERMAECRELYPALRICPDSGHDLGCPNVRQARKGAEALQRRYEAAKLANPRNQRTIDDFEAEVDTNSKVILTLPYVALLSILNSENALYGNYYSMVGNVRLYAEASDHRRRIETDNRMFGAYKEQLIFCVLSLDRTGSWSYGAYHLSLHTDMIIDRVSFTHKNTFRHQEWFDEVELSDGYKHWLERPGFRSDWSMRSKLAVAKLASALRPETLRVEFPGLLLQSDGARHRDDFIEGQIHGDLTRRGGQSRSLADRRRICLIGDCDFQNGARRHRREDPSLEDERDAD